MARSEPHPGQRYPVRARKGHRGKTPELAGSNRRSMINAIMAALASMSNRIRSELGCNFPQRLKPRYLWNLYGAVKAAPLQSKPAKASLQSRSSKQVFRAIFKAKSAKLVLRSPVFERISLKLQCRCIEIARMVMIA